MPFTPSHAVIALPFVRTPLIPAAIAIGAMTPDLPLFLRSAGITYGFTHDIRNVLWTTVIAFVLLLLWLVVLRPALVELAPDAVAARLPGAWRAEARDVLSETIATREWSGRPLLVALSLLLGVFSHIAWDLFTHEGRWGVEALPVLRQMWGPLAAHKWLQHGSSVVGLLILAVFALLWLRRRPVAPVPPRLLPAWVRRAWMLSLPLVLAGAWALGLVLYGPLTAQFTVQHLAYRMLPPASGVWGALTVVLCVAVVVLGALRRRRAAHHSAASRPQGRGGA